MTVGTGPTPYGANNSTMPGQDAFAVTPSDVTNFNITARAIYVGAGGDVSLVTSKGNTVIFVGAQTGSILPIMCNRVNFTNTTALNILGII
jgi:hypothetical protein